MPQSLINGVNLYYEGTGAGRCLILCHGYAGSHLDWSYQVPVLSQKYRLVTLDYRGHGASGAPSQASDYSIPIFARDVYGLAEHLGIKEACLVGHSMGGFIVLELALAHPELVKGLVLVDTSSLWVQIPGYRELRGKLAEIARGQGMEAAFEYDAEHNPLFRERFRKHPKAREVARRQICRTSVDGFVHSGQAIMGWPGVTPRLSEVRAPALVVVGEEDSHFLEPAQALVRAISDARLGTVPGAAHCPHQERPSAFNRLVLGFLGEIGYI